MATGCCRAAARARPAVVFAGSSGVTFGILTVVLRMAGLVFSGICVEFGVGGLVGRRAALVFGRALGLGCPPGLRGFLLGLRRFLLFLLFLQQPFRSVLHVRGQDVSERRKVPEILDVMVQRVDHIELLAAEQLTQRLLAQGVADARRKEAADIGVLVQ